MFRDLGDYHPKRGRHNDSGHRENPDVVAGNVERRIAKTPARVDVDLSGHRKYVLDFPPAENPSRSNAEFTILRELLFGVGVVAVLAIEVVLPDGTR
mgnify:CR=1 FL=1